MYQTHKIISKIFYLSLSYRILEIQHGFYTYRTSQFGLVMFQMLNNHMWPEATLFKRVARMINCSK